MRHSRLPWIVETGPYSGNDWLIGSAINGKDYSITTDHVHASAMNGADAEDDAKFIVEACNNYEAVLAQRDDLLEACKMALEVIKWNGVDEGIGPTGIGNMLRAAIAAGQAEKG
jgi:hypothetical protein